MKWSYSQVRAWLMYAGVFCLGALLNSNINVSTRFEFINNPQSDDTSRVGFQLAKFDKNTIAVLASESTNRQSTTTIHAVSTQRRDLSRPATSFPPSLSSDSTRSKNVSSSPKATLRQPGVASVPYDQHKPAPPVSFNTTWLPPDSTPKPSKYKGHCWVRVGERLLSNVAPAIGNETIFPPFCEKARFYPVHQYRMLLYKVQSLRKFCRKMNVTLGLSPLSHPMKRLLEEFVDLLSFYNIRYWIHSKHPQDNFLSIGLDMEMLWVLFWISSVFRHSQFVLAVSPAFFFRHARLMDLSCHEAMFYDSESDAAILIHGFSVSDDSPTERSPSFRRPKPLLLEDFDPISLENSAAICTLNDGCVETKKIFPLACTNWWNISKQLPMARFVYNPELMVEMPCSISSRKGMSSKPESLHRWVGIGERVQDSSKTAPDPRFPPFTETSRFLSASRSFLLQKDSRKFFQEKSTQFPHFDKRYFNASISEVNISSQMRELFREFAKLMDHYNVPYFLDGGSLLGWFWNRAPLPWDDDIDVGIRFFSVFVLQWISEVYQNDEYRLEVNPHFVVEGPQSYGNNMIDARFISKKTGVFIDLCIYHQPGESEQTAQLFLDEIGSYYNRTTAKFVHKATGRRYPFEMLWPFQRTEWMDGIGTWVPNDPIRKLHYQYGPQSTVSYGPRKSYKGMWVPLDYPTNETTPKTKASEKGVSERKSSGTMATPVSSSASSKTPTSLVDILNAAWDPMNKLNDSFLQKHGLRYYGRFGKDFKPQKPLIYPWVPQQTPITQTTVTNARQQQQQQHIAFETTKQGMALAPSLHPQQAMLKLAHHHHHQNAIVQWNAQQQQPNVNPVADALAKSKIQGQGGN